MLITFIGYILHKVFFSHQTERYFSSWLNCDSDILILVDPGELNVGEAGLSQHLLHLSVRELAA
jgi:hypothetical protein